MIRRLVAERRIPFIKWGHLLRFDPCQIAEWLASQRVPVTIAPIRTSRTLSVRLHPAVPCFVHSPRKPQLIPHAQQQVSVDEGNDVGSRALGEHDLVHRPQASTFRQIETIVVDHSSRDETEARQLLRSDPTIPSHCAEARSIAIGSSAADHLRSDVIYETLPNELTGTLRYGASPYQPPPKSPFTTTRERRRVASWSERPNASAIASSSSGNRWPYRSSVTLIDEWPIRDWIAFGCAPAAIASATLVCRRSWNRHDTAAAACALEKWCVRKLDDDSGLPAALANTSASGPGCAKRSRWAASSEAVNGEMRDRTHASRRLRLLAQERPVLELHQLFGDPDLPVAQVDLAAAQPDQLAPTHPAVDGDVDQRPVPLVVRLGEPDRLIPVEERHLPLRDPRRVDALARVGQDLLLLHRDLQHAAKRPVVPMHRRRRDASGDLVVQPVLDLVGRQLPEPVRTEPRQHVLVEVTAVGLLRRRRQPPAQRQELLGPLGEWRVGVARIDPLAAELVGIDLAEEPLGVGLAGERARLDACRAGRESSSVLAPLLLRCTPSEPPREA